MCESCNYESVGTQDTRPSHRLAIPGSGHIPVTGVLATEGHLVHAGPESRHFVSPVLTERRNSR